MANCESTVQKIHLELFLDGQLMFSHDGKVAGDVFVERTKGGYVITIPDPIDTEPTPYGMTKWSDGLYEGAACTCTATECDEPCHGECGCQACHDAYSDFLSSE